MGVYFPQQYEVKTKKWFNEAWQIYTIHNAPFIGFYLILLLIGASSYLLPENKLADIAFMVFQIVIGGPLYCGFYCVILKIMNYPAASCEVSLREELLTLFVIPFTFHCFSFTPEQALRNSFD